MAIPCPIEAASTQGHRKISFMAGRCISVNHDAPGHIRVMRTCGNDGAKSWARPPRLISVCGRKPSPVACMISIAITEGTSCGPAGAMRRDTIEGALYRRGGRCWVNCLTWLPDCRKWKTPFRPIKWKVLSSMTLRPTSSKMDGRKVGRLEALCRQAYRYANKGSNPRREHVFSVKETGLYEVPSISGAALESRKEVPSQWLLRMAQRS